MSGTGLTWLALLALTALYAATSTWNEAFWWSDAPQHALNGALIHDWILSGRWGHPVSFADSYFLHYPAINIALYPPLFPVVEAAAYGLAGVSDATAQALETCFTLLAVVSAYRIARLALPAGASLGAAALVLALPVVALWSRQVMLEMPALSLLLAGSVPLLRYAREPRAAWLYQGAALLVLAINMKQTAAFAAAAWAVLLLWQHGWGWLRRRHLWVAAAIAGLALLPLAVFTLTVARYNLQSVGGTVSDKPLAQSLTFYAAALPDTAGWLMTGAALAYLALLAWRGAASAGEKLLARWAGVWFGVTYVLSTAVGHKESRYAFFMVAPLGIVAALLLHRVLRGRSWAVCATGFAVLAVTLVAWPVRQVDGYQQAASYILAHASPGSVVLFHGLRSPNFVYSMRSRGATPSLYILRAEKFLVHYTIHRDNGVVDLGLTPPQVQGLIDRYGIEYVVMQPDFWTDQPSVAAFQALIRGGGFERAVVIPVHANFPGAETRVEIWRNLHPVPRTGTTISFDLPVLGRALNESLGAAPAAGAAH